MKSTANRASKLTLVAILAVASLPAFAVDWHTVATTSSQTVLVDHDSVHVFHGDVRAWVMHSYTQTESLGDMYPHRSKVMVYSVECGQRELGYLQWSMQSGEFGGGRTVWADRASYVDHYPAKSDVVDNALVDSVCALYAMHDPSHQSTLHAHRVR